MGYGIAPNASYFTGKEQSGNLLKNRRKKPRTKRVHKNKYEKR